VNEHLATEEAPFHFTDSGLDNVYLIGIQYFRADDGTAAAEISAMKQLMRLIASDLLYSESTLTGQEIRFLRKRLGKKSVEFAQWIKVEPETLSRIENEKQPVSAQVDALTRLYYLLSCDDPQLKGDAARLMQLLQAESDRARRKKIVLAMTENREWAELKAA
jgi:DNA-binding transcriptional regulator YiaG